MCLFLALSIFFVYAYLEVHGYKKGARVLMIVFVSGPCRSPVAL